MLFNLSPANLFKVEAKLQYSALDGLEGCINHKWTKRPIIFHSSINQWHSVLIPRV